MSRRSSKLNASSFTSIPLQRFIQYLASRNTLFNLSNFLDKSGLQGTSATRPFFCCNAPSNSLPNTCLSGGDASSLVSFFFVQATICPRSLGGTAATWTRRLCPTDKLPLTSLKLKEGKDTTPDCSWLGWWCWRTSKILAGLKLLAWFGSSDCFDFFFYGSATSK